MKHGFHYPQCIWYTSLCVITFQWPQPPSLLPRWPLHSLSSDISCRPLSSSPHPGTLPMLFSLWYAPCMALHPPCVSSLLPPSSNMQSFQVTSHHMPPQSTHPSLQSCHLPWLLPSSPPHFPWAPNIPYSVPSRGYSYPVQGSLTCAWLTFKTDTLHSTHRLWHLLWSIMAPGTLTRRKWLGEGIVHGE